MAQQHQVYSVYDSKAQAFAVPFFVPTKGIALRSFSSAVNDPQTDLFKYPADYTLFHLGSYDDATGKITPLKTPESIALAQEFKQSV